VNTRGGCGQGEHLDITLGAAASPITQRPIASSMSMEVGSKFFQTYRDFGDQLPCYRRQLPDALKREYVAIGRDHQTGVFRTAVLKEYPPAFSAALASAVADCFSSALRRHQLTEAPLACPATESWLKAALTACAAIRTEALVPLINYVRKAGRCMAAR